MPAFYSPGESSEMPDSPEDVHVGLASRLCAALFPPVCVFCGCILLKEKDDAAAFFSEKLQICRKCMAILPLRFPEERRISCLSNPYEGDPAPDMQVLVPFRYEDPIVQALRAVKFHDAPYIGISLSFFMSEALLSQASLFDAVIPVPLSSKRRKQRGYNQAELLAEPLARRMNLPYIPAFLIRSRHTRQQSRFSDPVQRSANIFNAFSVPDEFDLEGLSILLVDDVTTTGSTLHEAAVTLYRKGARYVAGIAAASGRI
ncbi:MAG: ComF family protein [Eubacteriales bacterium]